LHGTEDLQIFQLLIYHNELEIIQIYVELVFVF